MFDETELTEQFNTAASSTMFEEPAVTGQPSEQVLQLKPMRRNAARNLSSSKKLVLTAHWDGSLEELRSLVNSASDWGPFELLHATPAPGDKNTRRAVRCSFLYHGRAPDRARFESNLFELLRKFAFWTGDKPAQHTA